MDKRIGAQLSVFFYKIFVVHNSSHSYVFDFIRFILESMKASS